MKIVRTLFVFMMVALFGNVASAQTTNDGQVHIWPVHGNVYLLAGAGGNITLSVGKDGVLMVDAGNGQMTDKVVAAIQQFTKQRDPIGPALPVRFLINTCVDADQTGGNLKMA